tara:strand:- start:5831 stop:6991 length:1161 start_codon:yes stop_codon:yes gene_type:complete
MEKITVARRGLFLVSLPIFFINFALPVQAKQLGASALEIGFLFSLFTFSLLILRPLVGFGLNRFGRKPFFLAAMLSYTGAHAFFATADTISWMYLARLIQGVGAALLLITINTITTDLTEEAERTSEMGRNIEVQTRSSIVGATIAFTLVGAIPMAAWHYSFSVFGIAALFAFVYLTLRFSESQSPSVHEETGDFQLSPTLRRFMVIVFFSAFANALIQPIYLIYLQDKFDLRMDQLSWAFIPAALVFAILPSRLGKLTHFIGTVNALALGFVSSGVLYLLLPFLDKIILFVVLYTVSAIGWVMSDPARKALVSTFGDSSTTGRNFGVTELYAGVGATLGPVVGGYSYDTYGATVTFVCTGVLLVATAVLAKILLQGNELTPKKVN